MKFITVLTYVFAVLSTLLCLLRIYGAITYTDLERTLDRLRGVRVIHPVAIPGVTAIVCWAWIFTS